MAVTRRRATRGGPSLNDVWVDFVCLPRSFAYDRVLRMARDARVVCKIVAVHGQAAAAQNNQERRYDEQSLHWLDP